MKKKCYIQPQLAQMPVAPQTIVCQSVHGGGNTSDGGGGGQITSGDAPQRKINVLYI